MTYNTIYIIIETSNFTFIFYYIIIIFKENTMKSVKNYYNRENRVIDLIKKKIKITMILFINLPILFQILG